MGGDPPSDGRGREAGPCSKLRNTSREETFAPRPYSHSIVPGGLDVTS